METKFNFNSQVCTDINQSKRLLALGLKPETADMFYDYCKDRIGYTWYLVPKPATLGDKRSIPAWSLHRLLSLLPKYIRVRKESFGRFKWVTLELTIDAEFVVWYREDIDNSEVEENFYAEDIYTSLCDCIEWLTKEGHFPKEYLE